MCVIIVFVDFLLNVFQTDVSKVQQWLKCDFSIKEQVRANFVQTIQSSFKEMALLAFQIIITYGAADISINELSLVASLVSLIGSPGVRDDAKTLSFEVLYTLLFNYIVILTSFVSGSRVSV